MAATMFSTSWAGVHDALCLLAHLARGAERLVEIVTRLEEARHSIARYRAVTLIRRVS